MTKNYYDLQQKVSSFDPRSTIYVLVEERIDEGTIPNITEVHKIYKNGHEWSKINLNETNGT